MRVRTVAAVCLITCWASSARPAEIEGIRQGELNALAKELKTYAAAWADGELRDEDVRAIAKKLKGVTYDEKSAPLLRVRLSKLTRPPEDLFVANRLIRPLLLAKTSVIRLVLERVERVHGRMGQYLKPMEFTPEQVKRLQLPTYQEDVSADDMMLAVAASQELRQRKLRIDNEAKRNNQEVYELRKTLCVLALLANKTKRDRQLLARLRTLKGQKAWLLVDLIQLIGQNARSMDEKRAEFFYNTFVRDGVRLRLVSVKLIRPFDITFVPTATSKIVSTFQHPGVLYLQSANLLAPVAKQPAVNVPDSSVVAAMSYLKSLRPIEGGRMLHEIATQQADSPAAVDARKLLAIPANQEHAAQHLRQRAEVLLKPDPNIEDDKPTPEEVEGAKKLFEELLKYYPKTKVAWQVRQKYWGE